MPLRVLILCIVLLSPFLVPGKLLAAYSPFTSHLLAPLDEPLTMTLGDQFWCLASRAGVNINELATLNRILKPSNLPAGLQVTTPPAKFNVQTGIAMDTLLGEAIRAGIPEYTMRMMNAVPLYSGGIFVLPVHSKEQLPADNCLPYPLKSIALSSSKIVRGQTLVVAVETMTPVFCEVQYLDLAAPCYPFGEEVYIAMLGVSALENPGNYIIRLRFMLPQYEAALDIPFELENGNYGYQYINPPASLYELMDEEVMRAEEQYLEPYREVRTPYKLWSTPLNFPLTMQLPISADYGDRRSYGGSLEGYHSGVDYRAWTGLPVLAPADGVVLLNEKLRARGNAILIDHGWGLVTGYWHLSKSNVEIGQHVMRGEIIGEVGNTGLSTGSHLHWETWVNGVSVDGKQWYDPLGFSEFASYFAGNSESAH